MTPRHISRREGLLLIAALHPDAEVAAANWQEWSAEIELEDAPYPELRLLTAVYAHLAKVAPSLSLPEKLRGKARATFAANSLLAHGCLPTIEQLGRHSPVLLAKGFAICIRFGVWSSRTMGDVDIHVPRESLGIVCKALAEDGWIPKHGMTWESLVHRTSLRRASWNVTKGESDLDLHWRLQEGPEGDRLSRTMWASAEPAEYLGRPVSLQSAEFALITALEHGFKVGTHGDALQCVIDAALLLPECRVERLGPLLRRTDLVASFTNLLSILERSGLSALVGKVAVAGEERFDKTRKTRGEPRRSKRSRWASWRAAGESSGKADREAETTVLRRPVVYRLWEALGRKPWFERILLRWAGPFSKPLAASGSCEDDYDLRECAVIDRIGGPGWAWPEPEHTCFWSDRPDARLLIPLSQVADHIIAVGLGPRRSPNPGVRVFANGVLVTALNINARVTISDYCLVVPKSVLFGPWVELSFRPEPYDVGTTSSAPYHLRRSVPARRLRVFDAQKMSEVFSSSHKPQLYFTMLDAEEPQASKFARIKERIANSPHRTASGLPVDFDPVVYILSYPDLFEHEVDPYEHYLLYGRREGRWEQ